MTALDVLLLSNGPPALGDVTAELEAAGHRVHRCHSPSASAAWPCVALDGGPCPLDAGIDVALDVRTAVSSHTSPWEDGVACARREDVPLVVAGTTSLQPFGTHAEVVVEGRSSVVAAVKLAAERAITEQEAMVESVCGAPVTLERLGDDLHVTIHADPEPSARSMMATRAGGAARALRPRPSHLTVGFSAPAGG